MEQIKSYVDIFEEHNPYTPLTAEEKDKIRKRERASRIVSAVGDGISALSNLFATTKYAPHVEQKMQLSARNQERWNRLHARRQAEEQAWQQGYMRALEADRRAGDQERNYQLRLDAQTQAAKDRERTFNHQQRIDARNFNYQKERDKAQDQARAEQLKEQERHNQASERHQQSSLALRREEMRRGEGAGGRQDGYVFQFSNGSHSTVSKARLNDSNIEVLWNKLPQSERAKYMKTKYTEWGTPMDSVAPDREGKLQAIGALAYDNPELQTYIRQIAGEPVIINQKKATPVRQSSQGFVMPQGKKGDTSSFKL